MPSKTDPYKHELNARTLKHLVVYLRENYSEEQVTSFFKDEPISKEYLEDENNWFSFENNKHIFDKLVEFTKDEMAPYKAGLCAAKKEVWGSLFLLLKAFSSPKKVMKMLINYAPRFNKCGKFTIKELTINKLILEYKSKPEYKENRYICLTRIGQFSSIPIGFGLPPAKCKELKCQIKGDDACLYEFTWDYKKTYVKKIVWIFLGIGFGVIVSLFLNNFFAIPLSKVIGGILGLIIAIVCIKFSSIKKRLRLYQDSWKALDESVIGLETKYKELNESNKELNRYKNHLEELVSARTKELKDAQTQIVQSEKMASLGMLASGMAHEIMNPINFIQNSAEPLQENVEKLSSCKKLSLKEIKDIKEDSSQLFGIINEGVDRINKIVRGITTFTRGVSRGLESYNINEAVKSALIMAEHEYKKRIEIKTDLKASREIKCNPGQINQVVLNIFMNAIQAVGDCRPSSVFRIPKGKIEIKTWEEDNQVKLSIKDNGPGIKEEIKAKIFDPFFTTKETKPGQNMGLGLLICYNIIDVHQGKIDVNSKENKGAEFVVSLPLDQDSKSH